MKILFLLNAITSLFANETTEIAENYFPAEQIAENQALNYSSNYVYSIYGELLETSKNSAGYNKFFVKLDDNDIIEINLTGSKTPSASTEIGYLARILSAEALLYEKGGKYHNISMFTRVCIAETIKNRKNSDFGFYGNYDTYRNVIFYTGYATYAKEFTDTYAWLRNQVAKKRFVQEVLPPAIFIYFNDTNFTDGATGFITPAKLSTEVYNKFKKRTIIEVPNIDSYYEFTFWKY